jgi:hypothetical protein
MAVAEIARVNQWISQQLRGDPGISTSVQGRVYSDMAPQGAALPLVTYQFLGGSDKQLTARSRLSGALYLVRAIAQSQSYGIVEPIADRIETVLSVPNEGTVWREIRIVAVQREQPFQRKDSEFGIPTVYMGGIYRVRFQLAAT